MLVLARKQGQTIVIDGRIKITVLKVKGSAVRLGIDAPEEVSIRRGELEPLHEGGEDHAPQAQQKALRDLGTAAEGECNFLLL
jgi:carbon storage regulator